MKITLSRILLLYCIALFVGCENNNNETPYLEVSQSDVILDYWGTDVTIDITSNANWIIEGESVWCKVSKTSGNGNAKVAFSSDNIIDDGRTISTHFMVRCGDIERRINVKQVGKGISTKDNVITYEYDRQLEIQGDFGANIVSHEYIYLIQKGTITFDAPVTMIPDKAFNAGIYSIAIPDTVTKIGEQAFRYCAFKIFAIPENVTEIGEYAFGDCVYLREIKIPDGVKEIKNSTFANNESLKKVYLHDNITKIGDDAFEGCTALEFIELNDNINYIGKQAFHYCSALKSVNIPKSLDKLSASLFLYSGLEHIVIPDNVTSIDESCFGYTPLVSAELGKGVAFIGNKVFDNCKNLKSIRIPSSVRSIGEFAFRSCVSLVDAEFSEGIIELGDLAFNDCSSLEVIHLPNSITHFGFGMFQMCTSLREVYMGDGIEYIDDYRENYAAGIFNFCNNLEYVKLSRNLRKIPNNTFATCGNLRKVEMFDKIESIGVSAFAGCVSLESLYIPSSITFINNYAFNNCYKFDVYVDDIKVLTNMEYPSLASGDESIMNHTKDLYIDGMLTTELVIPDDVYSIKDYTFWGATNITNVIFGDNVSSIGCGAFCYSGLRELTLPDTITSVGEYAFSDCENLKTVTIEASITTLPNYLFEGCDMLCSVTMSNSVQTMGFACFSGCLNLSDIVLSTSITEISTKAFSGCDSLKSVKLHEGIASICKDAFRSCGILESVDLPSTLTRIEAFAFDGCPNLRSVYCRSAQPPKAIDYLYYGWKALDNNASGRKIFVPIGSSSDYKSAYGWKSYAASIEEYDFQI